ncbi:hypothetical protein PHACT_05755 [Pseudohongiella acticola]|jgi:4-coumarate--CoA ligase (photoactive yellow protein activation family)|uniref:AMP-dependent synthetase/ligase domain-containing protein n=1 Tax=Pseudohongiella acticola TaxID=1524254 RepID=A0A1E8CK82_9GAMM|nr:AMP-binding protein [Pseudohongiella acticola]OFE12705.1 hypothetical protein PHACT_05755 [Pseudohongiella acticola]
MWWQQPGLLETYLHDFLSDSLHRRGLGDLLLNCDTPASGLLADPRYFGYSSLDMVELARRFALALGLDRTGISDLLLARRSAEGWLGVARRSLEIDDSTLHFYSSGSTGEPTASAHSLHRLKRETDFFQTLLPVPKRIVSTVPCHHIYGFIWSVLLPSTLACEQLRIHPTRSLPENWAQQLRDEDLIVATPEVWTLLLNQQIKLPDRFTGISSTAPLPVATAAAIRRRYPNATLTEVYGSSETAGLAWRQQDNVAFTLLPFWTLQSQNGSWLVQDQDDGQQYPLSDRLQLHDSSHFSILGRTDTVIQIHGNNINLALLADTLQTHIGIKQARVRSDSNSGDPGGSPSGLHYFLVLDQPPADISQWCRNFSDWLADSLGNVPPPRSVIIAPSLPVNTLGKTVSWDPSQYPLVTGCFRSGFGST